MDAFFAAIEQRDDPDLRSKPVVVGADPKLGKGRGVVSTCSYEARKFGIHSAMPISLAYRKCPHAIFVRPDMEKYSAVSRQIYDIFYDFTPEIEPISIDEAFLDITGSYHLFGAPLETCLEIKKRIKAETRLTASCGLAPTMMAAKIASDLKKPDGMVEVTEEGLLDFLWPLPVRKLWGLGPKSEEALNGMGIKTIGDIARRKADELVSIFGKHGAGLWELANGIDERSVRAGPGEAKSVSNETTFDEDTSDKDRIYGALAALSQEVSGRLRHDKLKGRTITLKIRLEGFHTYTRAVTIDRPTNFYDDIYGNIKALYGAFDRKGKRVRLVGAKVSNFSPAGVVESLFSENADERRERTHRAIDRINEKFGGGAIFRAESRFL
jgi:nucleotidyltransferase/DNA polymerase involved in DNA repair